MTDSLRVAACQLRSTSDPDANLAAAGVLVARAAAAGARVAVLPEATMARFGTTLADVAQPVDGPFGDGIRALAREHGLWVVAGMFEPADTVRVYNALLATDGTHDVVYRKRHLFDAFGQKESTYVAPGEENVTFDVDGVSIGLATCYDVRFAHQFTELGLAGAEVILLPASWASGEGKTEQWRLLVRSRAMDAQAFLVAADQAWQEPSGRAANGVGHSMVVGPLGVVEHELDDDVDVLVADLDLIQVRQIREHIPVLRAQRGSVGD